MSETSNAKPVELVVYDFDGTSITGNSPVLLVKYLIKQKMLKPSVVLRIGAWGAAYKFRLPQNESWVRGLVFSCFKGKPKQEVDEYLARFYDDVIAERFRVQADESMRAHTEQGRVVMVVSATFEPIARRAAEHHPFDIQISTRMKVAADGTYTDQVDGLPIEGEEKISAVKRYADGKFGEGNWILDHAYGDHHSDRPLLAAAVNPHAVSPDKPLERTAKRFGWDILDWH